MDYRTQTVTVNGATLVVRESIGADVLDQAVIYNALSYNPKSKRALNRATRFAQAVLRTTVQDGDLGFAWVDADADNVEMQAAFNSWLALSAGSMAAWEVALSNVNKALVPKNSEPPKDGGNSSATLTDSFSPAAEPTTSALANSGA